MGDDLRVVGEGTLAAAQRWKARAETAEAERDEANERLAKMGEALRELREDKLGDDWQLYGKTPSEWLRIQAEVERLREGIRAMRGPSICSKHRGRPGDPVDSSCRLCFPPLVTQISELRAERDKLREALARAITGLRVTIRADLNELADELAALATPAPVDEEER